MNKLIPISINKAQVESISIDFSNQSELKWYASVCLINDMGMRITSITIGNTNWDKKEQAELSLLGIDLSNQLRKEVNDAITIHMNRMNKTIGVDKN